MRGRSRPWLYPTLLLSAFAPALAASCSSSSAGGNGNTTAAAQGGSGGLGTAGASSDAGGAGPAGSGGAPGSSGTGGLSGSAGAAGSAFPFVPPAYAPGAAPSAVSFPASFRWAAASAGQQVESGLSQTDWAAWAKLPGKISGGALPETFFLDIVDAANGGDKRAYLMTPLFPPIGNHPGCEGRRRGGLKLPRNVALSQRARRCRRVSPSS